MANPTAVLDKATYSRGDTAKLTVTRDKGTFDVPVQVAGLTLNVHADVVAPVQINSDHTFALVSDDGQTAVYSTTV
jgi:hypothetical protein